MGAGRYPTYASESRAVGAGLEWMCRVSLPDREHLPEFSSPRWCSTKAEAEKRAALAAMHHVTGSDPSTAAAQLEGAPLYRSLTLPSTLSPLLSIRGAGSGCGFARRSLTAYPGGLKCRYTHREQPLIDTYPRPSQ